MFFYKKIQRVSKTIKLLIKILNIMVFFFSEKNTLNNSRIYIIKKIKTKCLIFNI